MTSQSTCVAVLACLGLLGGCSSGGQTGQPTSGSCLRVVRVDEPVEGVSAQQLLAVFGGDHSATLQWASADQVDQEITVHIAASPADSEANSCEHALLVPIVVAFATGDGKFLDSGATQLSAAFGSLEPVAFSFAGDHYLGSVILSGPFGDVSIDGSLEPLVDAGAGVATFSNHPGSAGSGGN